MFGLERIKTILRAALDTDLSTGVVTLIEQVVAWHGSDILNDDIAIVALELDSGR